MYVALSLIGLTILFILLSLAGLINLENVP